MVVTLAANCDLRYCKNSSLKGELLRLVFTESSDAEYSHTRRRLAPLFYAFAATCSNGIAVIYQDVLHFLNASRKAPRYALLLPGLRNYSHLDSLHCHLQRPFSRLVTSNEATCVRKDAAFDPTDLT